MSVKVHEKIFRLRQDVGNIEVDGLLGKLTIAWWLYPTKHLVANPVLGIAEAIVPTITSIVPFSDHIVEFGLDATSAVGHVAHAVGSKVGVLSPVPHHHELDEKPIHEQASFEMDQFLYEARSLVNTTIGFGVGVCVDLLTTVTNTEKLSEWVHTVHDLAGYLQKSGISKELDAVGPDMIQRMIILGRVQAKTRDIHSDIAPDKSELDEGYYFMKYATAAYGLSTIKAANFQKAAAGFRQSLTKRVSAIAAGLLPNVVEEPNALPPNAFATILGKVNPETAANYLVDEDIEIENLKHISEHIGIPENQILMCVTPGGCMDLLRHFIAVDKKKKAIVLAIRGTFSVSEVLIDIDGDTREFYGGQAHEGIAEQAENLWKCAGEIILTALKEHPGFELIICGHSLGAGTACLLTIKLYAQHLVHTKIWCYAFASPAVFSSLTAVPEAIESTINFIHDDDCVSFLSVANVRELLESLKAVGDGGGFVHQLEVMLGMKDPKPEVVDAVEDTMTTKLSSVRGAATSYVPATKVIWMRGCTDDGYTAYVFKPTDLPEIYVDVDMIADHFPPYYEEALKKLSTQF